MNADTTVTLCQGSRDVGAGQSFSALRQKEKGLLGVEHRVASCEEILRRKASCHPRSLARDPRWELHGPRRSVRLRKVDDPAHDCRARRCHGRRHPDRRNARQRGQPLGARYRDGIPELCALSDNERAGKHRIRPHQHEGPDPRAQTPHRRDLPYRGTRRLSQEEAFPALRRPTPACRACTRDGEEAEGLPHGRTALESRCEAPHPDEDRAHRPPSASRHDLRLCHARPDGSDEHGNEDRADARRRRAAGCLP